MNSAARRRIGASDPQSDDPGPAMGEGAPSLADWIDALGQPGASAPAPGRLEAPPHAGDEIAAMTRALDNLAQRIDAAETRQALAVSGVDRLLKETLARLEAGEREHTAVAARFEGAVQELSDHHAQLSTRLGRIEAEAHGPRSAEALRSLEATLGKVAGHLYRGETRTEQMMSSVRDRIERLESERADPEVLADAIVVIQALETRVDGLSGEIAVQMEAARTSEQRASQAVERMGREVVEVSHALMRKVQTAEVRGAEAIEQVGGEVARIAAAMEAKLGRADTIQAQALERLGAEIERISERLAERITQSETRAAAAIDEVGDQVARITERLGQRQERATDDLAERIRASEERTARLLVEARATIDELTGRAASPAIPEAAAETTLGEADGEIAAEGPSPSGEPAGGEEPASLEEAAIDESSAAAASSEATGEPPAPIDDSVDDFISAGPLVSDDPFALFEADATDSGPADADALGGWEAPLPAFRQIEDLAPYTYGSVHTDLDAAITQSEAGAAPAPGAEISGFEDPAPAREAQPEILEEPDMIPGETIVWAEGRPYEEPRSFDADAAALFRKSRARPSARRGLRASGRTTTTLGMGMAAAFGLALGGWLISQSDPHGPVGSSLGGLFGAGPHLTAEGTMGTGAGAPRAALALAGAPPQGTESEAAALYASAAARIAAGDEHAAADLIHAADLGYAPAQFYLARLCETGAAGLPKNPAQARRWTERAAQSGDARAMHNLALYAFDGEGGPKDATAAATWFRRAAELGVADSQFNLARLYEQGVGVPQNAAEAYKWYLIAARTGDPLAKAGAARMAARLGVEAKTASERAAGGFRPAVAPATAAPALAASPAAAAQKALTALGYYQGPTDGASTPALRLAIAAYQHDQGLPETGAADATTLARLTSVAPKSVAE